MQLHRSWTGCIVAALANPQQMAHGSVACIRLLNCKSCIQALYSSVLTPTTLHKLAWNATLVAESPGRLACCSACLKQGTGVQGTLPLRLGLNQSLANLQMLNISENHFTGDPRIRAVHAAPCGMCWQ